MATVRRIVLFAVVAACTWCVPAAAWASFGFLGEWAVGETESFGTTGALAADGAGRVWVLDGGQVRAFRGGDGQPLAVWSARDGIPQTTYPSGIAVDRDGGAVYLTYEFLNLVRKFAPDGRLLATWGDGAVRFAAPRGIATDAAGNVYVADGSGVQELSSAGDKIGQFGGPAGAGSLAVDAAGNLYVSDAGADAVYAYAPSGAQAARIGGASSGGPGPVTAVGDGIWVVDANRHRLLHFASDGAELGGCAPTGDQQLGTVVWLASGPDGTVYVGAHGRVLRFGEVTAPARPCTDNAPAVTAIRVARATKRRLRFVLATTQPGVATIAVTRLRSHRLVGTLTGRVADAGRPVSLRYASRAPLASGRYRATVTVADAFGNRSAPRYVRFSIG